ncbi:GOLPH3/VPS74 family protein [Arthrobacter sp. 9AX]|uniref:GOLPH3/VPS74 family protein n=1 Tax=Arthrobacter sp. 9AX TaxID=2653131 RepID=UPI00135C0723|nr:GPP34 family phosphoprotein [Arthrobacter sp. 9AX]
MNAEIPTPPELSLPQAFLLLATNDISGKAEVPVFALRTTVAGATLAELNLLGAIELRGKYVRPTDSVPETHLQRELELIRGKSRPHTPKWWVSALEGRVQVLRVYEGLVSLGIVEHVGEKHLGRFRAVRYPEKDHAPEAALLQRILATLVDSPEPEVPEPTATEGPADAATPPAAKHDPKKLDARVLALIALLESAGMFGKIFPDADRVWADELAKDYWPARAVEDELRLIRLAEEEAATL